MADEVNEAFAVIKARLFTSAALKATFGATSSTFRCYAVDQVPQSPTFPYILMDFAAGTDFQGLGTIRIDSRPLMLVRVVNRGPVDATVRAADKEMDSILQTTVRSRSGDYVFSIRRESPYRFNYTDGANNKFSESGGRYRLLAA